MRKLYVAFILSAIVSCQKPNTNESAAVPANDEFDIAHSDPAAVDLVDTVLAVAGGEKKWADIRFIQWKDGDRSFYWDKTASNVRIESPTEKTVSIVNLNTVNGQVKVDGKVVNDTDATYQDLIKKEKEKWLASAAKIFFPFLLKREAFALKYLGEENLNSRTCNVLVVTDTIAALSYKLFVDLHKNTIEQAQSLKFNSDSVVSTMTFADYKDFDGIRVAIPEGSGVKDVAVNAKISEKLFTDL